MKCYECKWLDRSVVLTSNPPQYGCTLGFGSHYADHECEYDFMPIVRCKDCKHRDLFSCPLAENDFQKDEDFCSWGERKGGDTE